MPTLTIVAPLAGWVAPLSEVPDAVFAERMLGDGVAIDPLEGELRAPCDGEVITLAKTHHALTIRAENGAEILMHIGLETVALQGEGFEPLVTVGAKVRRGDALLRFDLDLLAQRAKSLLTPIVVTNADAFRIEACCPGQTIGFGESLFELTGAAAQAVADAATPIDELTREVVVRHSHGIHARPAAVIAAAMRNRCGEVRVLAHGRAANAKSAVSLMGLGVHMNDVVTLTASGDDAAATLDALAPLVAGTHAPTEQSVESPTTKPAAAKRAAGESIQGVIASRGYALGRIVHLRHEELEVEEAGRGVTYESDELDRARAEVRAHLMALAKGGSRTAGDVIGAHLEFLDDVELLDRARRNIVQGKSAGFGWRAAVRASVETLRALNDPHLAERIADLLDIEAQVIRALAGKTSESSQLPERAIVIADELKPSQLLALDQSRIAGICTARGGPTSHVAILAASMGVPALAAAGADVLELPDDSWAVLDAEAGRLQPVMTDAERESIERSLRARAQRQQAEREAAQHECSTADGERIEVWANLASVADAQFAVTQGAEGCGLLRTEFLFLDRQTPPDEQEQLEQYQAIANALGDRPLTIRTLDIGGDKPVPYLTLPHEPNPALGLRGVRTSMWRPDLLRAQLRAILRVKPARNIRILIPMVTDAAEVRAVRAIIDELRKEFESGVRMPIGAMIETPASALLASELAEVVDYFSIGTNDLTQYVLAMDREHSDLAARIDGLHPAVLRVIAMTVEGARTHRRPVGVCGGLASEPAAVPILIGLGIRELSIVPAMIPQLKASIRTLTLEACATLAHRALQAGSADEVRALSAQVQTKKIRSSA